MKKKIKKIVAGDIVEVEEEVVDTNLVEIELAVAEVQARHEAAETKREEDGVVETEAETKAREVSEDLELKVARREFAEEEQKHVEARDQRIKSVKGAIESARLARVAQEELGIAETEGAKLDREAKEAKDLEEASKLNVVEDFTVENLGNPDINKLVEKLKEVICYLNKNVS